MKILLTGGRLLQVGTDFVFSGQQGSPYRPEQGRDPLGAYGRTKAAGEEAVEQLFGTSGQALGVVEDQVGCPTSTATLAAALV
jgi:dTDP-4-dehydrorhamnose reductase